MKSTLPWLSLVLALGCGTAAGDVDGGASDAAFPDGGPDAMIVAPDASLDSSADAGEIDPVRAAAVCAALDEFLATTSMPGGMVGVRFASGGIHVCVGGLADVPAARPMTQSDRFRIASVTKTFVGALILLLVEDGALTLDDRLSDWVEGFGTDPTIAQMLNHTSGLGDYVFDDALRAEAESAHTEEELLAVARTKASEFAPGTVFRYSNTNYLLLGAIASAAGEQPWAAQVRERLLDPLALTDTFVDGFEPVPGDYVRGYDMSGTVDLRNTFHGTVAGAAGCMVSNARDLLAWAHALYGGSLLSAETLTDMKVTYRVPFVNADGSTSGTDFVGLSNFIEDDGTFMVSGHSGGTPGYSSNLRYLELDGTAQVYLINGDATSEERRALTNAVWEALLL